MKTREQVLAHLKENGYTKRAIDKVCAYMVAKGLKSIDEKIVYKKGDNDFESFVEWFNKPNLNSKIGNPISEETAKELNEIFKHFTFEMPKFEWQDCEPLIEEFEKIYESYKKPPIPSKEPKPKYKVGDWVRVVDCGKAYGSYERKFKELGFKDKEYNYVESSGVCGKVFAISKHEYNVSTLYAVDLKDGKQCLISENGIEAYAPKDGEFFYVKTTKDNEYIAQKKGDKFITSKLYSYNIKNDVLYADSECCCIDRDIVEIRPMTMQEEVLFKSKMLERKNLEYNGKDWVQKCKYKVGDYAKVIKKGIYWNEEEMDYLLGRLIKITEIRKDGIIIMELDSISKYGWAFTAEDLEPSTKEAYDKQCKRDSIKKAEDDYLEWRRKHFDVFAKTEQGSGVDHAGRIGTYVSLYAFAQWQNGLNKETEMVYYLSVDGHTSKLNRCEDEREYAQLNGSIYFNTSESAQLAIDVLGEDLIKKALI